MNIIEFPKHDPHMTGEAICLQCKHEWVAVVPSGTTRFECPECHTIKGLFKYECMVKDGEQYWECQCGCGLFYLTPNGHLCPNCGIYQQY